MKALFLLLLLSFASTLEAHDIRIAIYELSESDDKDHLILNASVDAEDLEKSLRSTYKEYQQASSAEKEQWMIIYFSKHLQFNIGGQFVQMKGFSFRYEEGFVKVNAVLPYTSRPIRQINVVNTCLIDYTEGHSNIIKCKLHGKLRSFRLTEDRTSTLIEY